MAERTGLELGYVEQLYTFGDRDRAARSPDPVPLVISVAYLALVREEQPSGSSQARWRDWYTFFSLGGLAGGSASGDPSDYRAGPQRLDQEGPESPRAKRATRAGRDCFRSHGIYLGRGPGP